MKVLLEKNYNGVKIKVIHGDITDECTEAIVNAANSSLQHGGGVAGAIVKKGGTIIQEESNRIGYVPTGKAVYTSAGNLKAKYVIHTVGPIWGEGNEEEKLRSAIRSALEVAERLKLKSIALPAVSTGVFGYPKELGVKVIADEVQKYIDSHPETTIREIHFTNIDKLTSELFYNEFK
ncbi:Appr-1-p processing domain protein [Desulfurobacterium thermolithotrophum DSM 11699]|uniref:Appr-1-p processing domain protein n=1 Tax=Desulfurobacterium thermolithotrophum (strain DSM 11699 / BSA) TaxID=868864 RepID=F0S119_DESTD|nr:macro domain-containing protein [Desulfurobacterium thermolithotrophum]ADY73897.1 Appr-1-p processing domain protein [Desulfurobacterium thermolithotrophum DSM 11699]